MSIQLVSCAPSQSKIIIIVSNDDVRIERHDTSTISIEDKRIANAIEKRIKEGYEQCNKDKKKGSIDV